jgi:hypothetical protein
MEERKEEVDVVADLVWKDVCEELVRRCEVLQDRIGSKKWRVALQ